jgi:hypothetical protein
MQREKRFAHRDLESAKSLTENAVNSRKLFQQMATARFAVMAGLVPAIHVFLR